MWFKVDDKLWGHPKWLAVSMRARGLWVSAGSWSAANGTDGKVPRHVLRTLGGSPADAKALVESGLWREARAGWIFHEWGIYQPDSASLKVKRAAEVEGGIWGNHRRWHIGKNVTVPGCAYCDGMPPENDVEPSESDRVPDRVSIGGPESGASRPVPDPDPLLGLSKSGGLPKQRASSFAPQACGESHDPKKSCGACAKARRDAKNADANAERDMNRRQREADEKARAEREAESARTLAEIEANPEAGKAALAKARAAIKQGAASKARARAARTTPKEQA